MSAAARTVVSTRPSRGWRIAFGVLTVIAGALILAWPGAAVVTVAIILGIHLIVAGVLRAVTALTRHADSGRTRALYLILGLLLVAAGTLCLVVPFPAAAFLVLLFGLSWVVNGVIELIHGFTGGGGWTIVSGAVSLAAGIVVLAYPASGAIALAWLFGLALIAIGLTVTIGAMVGRRRTGTVAQSASSFPARDAGDGRHPKDQGGGIDAAR
jgi:uncharacterized membrane protein HdeD (DUF308 family)